MIDKLQRIFDLINKTGDNIIVFDLKDNQPYVITPFDKYEMLAKKVTYPQDLTEKARTDKITSEMANFDNEPNFSDFDEYQNESPVEPDLENFPEPPVEPEEEFEPIGNVLDRKKEKNWQIPKERKEIVEDERYLEEITF